MTLYQASAELTADEGIQPFHSGVLEKRCIQMLKDSSSEDWTWAPWSIPSQPFQSTRGRNSSCCMLAHLDMLYRSKCEEMKGILRNIKPRHVFIFIQTNRNMKPFTM
ncbi:hypothetical protein XENOCAPTIV_001874 [Xenoophorus captivus]|uniref:Uncharacterized protein n=1 Tax=Xenoophorus captivus TaxID=1517983 RepID=A0ABV0QZ44_9TELE